MDMPPRVGLQQTESRKLFSQRVGREYQISVWLPGSYASSDRRYPVLYVLDGDLFFGVAASLMPLLCGLDRLPELLIVGIGYDRTPEEWGRLRELDFKIPEVQEDPPDSRADLFQAALKEEILPFIETHYRADSAGRSLCGYSSSGFFTLYSLLNEPGLFQHYLAGSPDTDLSLPYLLEQDEKLARRAGGEPIDLVLTVGDQENGTFQSALSSFQQLAAVIEQRRYPGLRLFTQVYPGENHGALGATLTLINGLRWCFRR